MTLLFYNNRLRLPSSTIPVPLNYPPRTGQLHSYDPKILTRFDPHRCADFFRCKSTPQMSASVYRCFLCRYPKLSLSPHRRPACLAPSETPRSAKSSLCHFPIQFTPSLLNPTSSPSIQVCSHLHHPSSSPTTPNLEFLRQIHPHPPRRQPRPLLLIHIHARIISLQQRRVQPLRFYVLDHLVGCEDVVEMWVSVLRGRQRSSGGEESGADAVREARGGGAGRGSGGWVRGRSLFG